MESSILKYIICPKVVPTSTRIVPPEFPKSRFCSLWRPHISAGVQLGTVRPLMFGQNTATPFESELKFLNWLKIRRVVLSAQSCFFDVQGTIWWYFQKNFWLRFPSFLYEVKELREYLSMRWKFFQAFQNITKLGPLKFKGVGSEVSSNWVVIASIANWIENEILFHMLLKFFWNFIFHYQPILSDFFLRNVQLLPTASTIYSLLPLLGTNL